MDQTNKNNQDKRNNEEIKTKNIKFYMLNILKKHIKQNEYLKIKKCYCET